MERTLDRGNPTTVEITAPQKPPSIVRRDETYALLAASREKQTSQKEVFDNLESWELGAGVYLSLNGSKDAFGREVSALGGRLLVAREFEDIIVSTYEKRPLRGRLTFDPDRDRLVIKDLEIGGDRSHGVRHWVEVLTGLEPRVKPGDGEKLLEAFLHSEPTPREFYPGFQEPPLSEVA